MINTSIKTKSNSSGTPMSVRRTTTSSRQCSSATERKTIPARPPSLQKNLKNTATAATRTVDPFEKRINHIRVHLLSNKIPKKTIPPEPTLVFDEFLYIGGLKSLNNRHRLVDLNITHILSVLRMHPRKDQLPSQVKHLFIGADDCIGFSMIEFFEQASLFIEEARLSNGRVLVHCACGVSRSTTLCCAYLMKYHSMSLEQAIVQIRSRRNIVQPNTGFLRQLLHYNEKLESDKIALNSIIEKVENL